MSHTRIYLYISSQSASVISVCLRATADNSSPVWPLLNILSKLFPYFNKFDVIYAYYYIIIRDQKDVRDNDF